MEDKTTEKELDSWIARLQDCKQLEEKQVRILCNKVRWNRRVKQDITPLHVTQFFFNTKSYILSYGYTRPHPLDGFRSTIFHYTLAVRTEVLILLHVAGTVISLSPGSLG